MAAVEPAWEKRYSLKVLWTDIAVVIVTVFGTQYLILATPLGDGAHPGLGGSLLFLAATACTWLAALTIYDTRNPSLFGAGPEEYKGVINATLLTFGVIALMLVFVSPEELPRAYIFIALVAGIVLLVSGRWIWRKRLHHQRKRSKNTYRTLIVGEQAHTAQIVGQLRSNSLAGYELVGAVSGHDIGSELLPGLPIVAHYDDLVRAVDDYNADTIIMTSSRALTPNRVRSISWQLEDHNVDLIMAASLTDIAGPRIHIRPVSGLPLIHVEYPEFSGWRYYAKRAFDFTLTLVGLIPACAVMLVLAVLIRREDSGPVLFRQVRLGLGGRPFTMYKLRSMCFEAEEQLPGLLDRSDGNEVLFKIRSDPRVTRIGRFMRRHSLDELPQIFNVLRGEMSLVGPRPPLPDEAEHYAEWVNRRLLVRPGISGLWQVSGRSDLPWDESVRLDLYYVENWSMTGDLLILWRTLRTVFRPEGAY